MGNLNPVGPAGVFEQNANNVRSVQRNDLYLAGRTLPPATVRRGTDTETRRTTVTVSGTFRIFQPQPRE